MSKSAFDLESFISLMDFIASQRSPEHEFLVARGWVPLGAHCHTGIPGWGKVIDGEAVTIPENEALEREGHKAGGTA